MSGTDLIHRSADVLDEHLVIEWVSWRRLESVTFVEPSGVLVNRVHEQYSNPDGFGGAQCPQHRVSQQPCSDPPSLHRRIDGQPCQERRRDGVSRHAFCGARCRFIVRHRRGCEFVVADDTILLVVVDDEGPRRPDGAGLRSVLLEPKVQRLDSAVKVVGVVSGSERFRVPKSGQLLRPGSAHEFDDRRLGLCRAIECRRECLPRVLL